MGIIVLIVIVFMGLIFQNKTSYGCFVGVILMVGIFILGSLMASWMGLNSNGGYLFGGIAAVVISIVYLVQEDKKKK